EQQFRDAKSALEKIVAILDDYLPSHEEADQIQQALGTIDYPAWILNWDYGIGSDEEGIPAVWITLYADEGAVPPGEYGQRASEMIPRLRMALTAAGIRRWPYIRMRTALEHKVG